MRQPPIFVKCRAPLRLLVCPVLACSVLVCSGLTLSPPPLLGQTIQDFDSPGTPYTVTNYAAPNPANPPSVVGPEASDGRYLELLAPPASGFTRSFGSVGFERTDPGPCRLIVAEFDFRMTCKTSNREGFNCADGFSFVALDTGTFGVSGAAPVLDEAGRSNEPTRSIGVGFIDFYLNGPNRVVVTFNNSIRGSFDIPLGELDLVTGLDGEKGAFHHARIEIESAPRQRVSVELIDGTDGGPVTVFDDFDLTDLVINDVPFEPYESRAAFGARTGDAYQWTDIDNVEVTYERCGSASGDPPTVEEEVEVAGPALTPGDPAVAGLPGGGYVTVWEQLDGDGFGVYARRYGPSGQAAGGAFRVNRKVAGNQTDPAVAVFEDGSFAFAWRDQQGQSIVTPDGRVSMAGITGSSVVARSFDPGGAAVSGEVEVAGDATGDSAPTTPEISADRESGVVVSWEDRRRARGRLLRKDASPRTPPVRLDSGAAGVSKPSVATAANGEFVAVWREDRDALRFDGAGGTGASSIVARRFAPSGQPVSQPVVVTDDAEAAAPSVAIGDDGGFVVAWEAPGSSGSDEDVYARRFDADDVPQGAPFTVNSSTAGRQRAPRVDVNAAGDFAIVWESDQGVPGAVSAGSSPSIVSRFFDPSGMAASEDVAVAETTQAAEPREPDVTLSDRDRATVTFTRRGPGDRSEGVFATDVRATLGTGTCVFDTETLCLSDRRFRVRARFEPTNGSAGTAQATTLTSDTGYFWFFEQSNVELVVKVLDACSFSDRFWVFAGGLTDVFVSLEVTDTLTGETRSYVNPRGTAFQPIQDTSAFATCGAADGARTGSPNPQTTLVQVQQQIDAVLRGGAAGADCVTQGDTLCLGGRFAVTVDYETASSAGAGTPFVLTADTGYFWFFEETNVELVVKVLDACGFSDRYWVFAGGLTNQGVDLRVVDTLTGAEVEYRNQRGDPFQPIQDTSAFDTCP